MNAVLPTFNWASLQRVPALMWWPHPSFSQKQRRTNHMESHSLKPRLGWVFLQRSGPATRPGRATRSPGCLWNPAGTECSRGHHPRWGAALRSHTPGPTSSMPSWWRPESAALEKQMRATKPSAVLGFVSHVDILMSALAKVWVEV